MTVNLIYSRKDDESVEAFRERMEDALSAMPSLITQPDPEKIDFLQIKEEESDEARTVSVLFRELKV